MAIPMPLWQWLGEQSEATGKSRNSLVTHLLEQARDVRLVERLERLERILDRHGIYE
jgi:hypothetical protein